MMGEVTFLGRGGGVPGKLTQQSTGSPQANADVGCLLNMFVAGLRMGTSRINTFSGDVTLGKTKMSFEQKYHEVQCIKVHYPEALV